MCRILRKLREDHSHIIKNGTLMSMFWRNLYPMQQTTCSQARKVWSRLSSRTMQY